MKILFLDIDGVMNSAQSCIYWNRKKKNHPDGEWNPMRGEFCPIAISNLNYLLEKIPDLQIVISSTWRIGRSIQQLKDIFKSQEIDPARVINKTPCDKRQPRGLDIQEFMDQNGLTPENIAILDDDSDMLHLMPRFIKTNNWNGLQWQELVEVSKLFGVQL